MKALVGPKRAFLLVAFVAAFSLSAASLLAASHRGGGHREYAVRRGSAGHRPVHYGHGGYGHGGHGHRGYGHGYYGHGGYHGYRGYGGYHGHRGYYGYPYYGRYYGHYGYYPYSSAWFHYGSPYSCCGWSASIGVGFGFGVGYGYAPYYWGGAAPVVHVSGPAYVSEAASDEARPRPAVRVHRPEASPSRDDTGRIRLAVSPREASLYVDDEHWGVARVTTSMILRAGPHTIDVVHPGFAPLRREVVVVPGEALELRLDLSRP